MNCKNCKYYYTEHFDSTDGGFTVGRCGNPLLWADGDGAKECADNGLLATCDEGRGELEVGENFGCIHFEKKDQ